MPREMRRLITLSVINYTLFNVIRLSSAQSFRPTWTFDNCSEDGFNNNLEYQPALSPTPIPPQFVGSRWPVCLEDAGALVNGSPAAGLPLPSMFSTLKYKKPFIPAPTDHDRCNEARHRKCCHRQFAPEEGPRQRCLYRLLHSHYGDRRHDRRREEGRTKTEPRPADRSDQAEPLQTHERVEKHD